MCRWLRATAFTSVMTASTVSGSPATSRTTSAPVRASAMSVLATSAGSPSAGRTSGPPDITAGADGPASPSLPPSALAATGPAGAGPDTGGRSLPISASTGSGTSGSVNTRAALASTEAAFVVNSPGSPGPEPTNVMRPGLGLRPRVVIVAPKSLSFSFLARVLPRIADQLSCAQFEQLRGHREPQLSGPTGSADAGRADHVGPVQRRHTTTQRQLFEDAAFL